MQTKIVVIAGKKGAGKDTIGKFLQSRLPNSKIYHFADKLKEFCVEYLDIPKELAYGTDEQKNTVSHLRWEQMPFYDRMKNKIVIEQAKKQFNQFTDVVRLSNHLCNEFDKKYDAFMTVREVLQYVGTELFRDSFGGKYWVNQLHKQIKKDNLDVAIVCDCRFPEEVMWGKENGIVIKLTRGIQGDGHTSETALDAENFDQSYFSAIIDNQNQRLETTEDVALYTVRDLLGIKNVD